ncbi:hypothetical protein [Deinococcus frigens]|uniref:hypothetical protein n=1 Tax=Deinococcus frigens TaxID=249403 RepID=UPI0004967321|nr:hypothetical protein [Deinococcus frigens]
MSQKRPVEEPLTDPALSVVENFLRDSESGQRRMLSLIDREIAKGGMYAEVPNIILDWYIADPRSRARIAELERTQGTVQSRAARRRDIQLEKKRQRQRR